MSMVGTVVWGALGLACVARGFFRPHRAVVQSGSVLRCAGENNQFGVCDPSDVIETEPGEKVFSTGPAKVVSVGEDYVNLVVQNEPVVLMYQGIAPTVEEGQHVGTGQKIGTSSGRIFFSVTQYRPNGVSEFVPPSAWLAVRGQELVIDNTGDQSPYCVQGREIIVPADEKNNCNLRSPRRAGFALLPVTVEMQ